jgi:hypothetical protein
MFFNSIIQTHNTTDKAVLQSNLHCQESKLIFPYILLNGQEIEEMCQMRVVDLNKIYIFS